MAQTVPVPTHAATWRGRAVSRFHLRRGRASERISFADLVWAHSQWITERDDRGDQTRQAEVRFKNRLAAFEAAHGSIVDAYWCRSEASAAALTVRRRAWPLRALGIEASFRVHRVTDWITGPTPQVAQLLHRCDTLAIRVNEVLRGTSERIAMQWLFSVESHLLGFVERSKRGEKDEVLVAETEARELEQIERYYQRAGRQAGRIVYFWGMIVGLAVLVGLAAAVGLLLWWAGKFDVDNTALQNLLATYLAGAIGAVISVLTRMSPADGTAGRLAPDYEIGRSTLRRLASFRPIIGAVLGVAVYFALLGGQISISGQPGEKSFYYFAIIAFLAGFSERWTRIILGSAEAAAGDHPRERRTAGR